PDMQMRLPARIWHGSDRLEGIASVAVRRRNAVTLEVVVARNAFVARVVIAAVHVALPELDGRAGDGTAVAGERAAGEIERRALGLSGPAGNLCQVGVALGRQGLRIERSLGLAGRRDP